MLTGAEKLFPIKGSGTSKTQPYLAAHIYLENSPKKARALIG